MKFKVFGWAATAALALVSTNVMAQQGNADKTIDKTQRKAEDTANSAQDNADRNVDPNRAAPARQAPQNLPDSRTQTGPNQQGNVPPQTFAPSGSGAVQGNVQGNANAQGGTWGNVPQNHRWRYRNHQGRWMYWNPSNQWVVWQNNQWIPYNQAFSQPMNGQPGYAQQGYAQQGYAQQGGAFMNQPANGNTPCNQSTSIYTGQTYPGNGQPNAQYGAQPGFGGPAPYASGYRGVQQNPAGVNPNALPSPQAQGNAAGQNQPGNDQLGANPNDGNRNLPDAPKPSPNANDKQQ